MTTGFLKFSAGAVNILDLAKKTTPSNAAPEGNTACVIDVII